MIILASQSKIRSHLLQNAGIKHLAVNAVVDEAQLQETYRQEPANTLAQILAKAKALSISKTDGTNIVIGADQTMECDGRVLHKVDTLAAASDTLLSLRRKTHFLHSAISVTKGDAELFSTVDTAKLTMRNFSPEFLENYLILSGEAVLQSVGCYQLEGTGINLFERIEGDYFTILGLPLMPLLAFLREIGELPS